MRIFSLQQLTKNGSNYTLYPPLHHHLLHYRKRRLMIEWLKRDLKQFGFCKVTPFLMEHLNCFLKVFLMAQASRHLPPRNTSADNSAIRQGGFRMRGERVSGLGGYPSPIWRSKKITKWRKLVNLYEEINQGNWQVPYRKFYFVVLLVFLVEKILIGGNSQTAIFGGHSPLILHPQDTSHSLSTLKKFCIRPW